MNKWKLHQGIEPDVASIVCSVLGEYPRLIYKNGRPVEPRERRKDLEFLIENFNARTCVALDQADDNANDDRNPKTVFFRLKSGPERGCKMWLGSGHAFPPEREERRSSMERIFAERNRLKITDEELRSSRNEMLHLIAAQVQAQEQLEQATIRALIDSDLSSLERMKADARFLGSEAYDVRHVRKHRDDRLFPCASTGCTLAVVFASFAVSTWGSVGIENKTYVGAGLIVLIGASIVWMWHQMRKMERYTEETNIHRILATQLPSDENHRNARPK